MKALTIVALFCSGLGVAACGGAPSDSTGSTADSLKGGVSAADGGSHGQGGQGQGSGHACKPLDGGPSPCARGDGGEDDDSATDDDGGDDGEDHDGGGHDGGHRPDAGKKD